MFHAMLVLPICSFLRPPRVSGSTSWRVASCGSSGQRPGLATVRSLILHVSCILQLHTEIVHLYCIIYVWTISRYIFLSYIMYLDACSSVLPMTDQSSATQIKQGTSKSDQKCMSCLHNLKRNIWHTRRVKKTFGLHFVAQLCSEDSLGVAFFGVDNVGGGIFWRCLHVLPWLYHDWKHRGNHAIPCQRYTQWNHKHAGTTIWFVVSS